MIPAGWNLRYFSGRAGTFSKALYDTHGAVSA